MSKHTPGPWYVQDDHGKRWIETEGNDDTIAEVHRRKRKGSVYSCEEAGANANLISAAPDLLEALIDVRRALELANFTGELAVVDAAIARAKGESQ